jgi:hypothetical protein
LAMSGMASAMAVKMSSISKLGQAGAASSACRGRRSGGARPAYLCRRSLSIYLYRLTSAGLASAMGALASAAEQAAEQAAATRAGTGKPRARVRPGPAAPGAVAGMTP